MTAAGRIRVVVAKPGLDGHSNGAEQIAVAARDAGMEVVYQGIRLTPEQIAAVARDEDVDVIGLSILSGSHLELVPDVLRRLREAGVEAPVVVGGIIPEEDIPVLEEMGVLAHAHLESGAEYHRTEEAGHVHLTCSNCGDEDDLSIGEADALIRLIEQHHGFEPDLTHFAIGGLCADCKKARGAAG